MTSISTNNDDHDGNPTAAVVHDDDYKLGGASLDPNPAKDTACTPSHNAVSKKRQKFYVSPAVSHSGENAQPQSVFKTPLPQSHAIDFATPEFRRKIKIKNQSESETGNDENKTSRDEGKKEEKKRQFRWSIDQMAAIRPVQFEESECSLPPEDWDPNMEHDRTQPAAIEQFWSRNTHIVPSPDVLPMSAKLGSLRQKFQNETGAVGESTTTTGSSTSPPDDVALVQSAIGFCSPSFPGPFPVDGSSSCHSSTTTSNMATSSILPSPLNFSPASPAFHSNHAKLHASMFVHMSSSAIQEDNLTTPSLFKDATTAEEEEELELSLSQGLDADDILADLGDDSGGFVRRRSTEENTTGTAEIDDIIAKCGGQQSRERMEAGEEQPSGSSGLGMSNGSGASGPPWETTRPPLFCIDASPIKPIYEP